MTIIQLVVQSSLNLRVRGSNPSPSWPHALSSTVLYTNAFVFHHTLLIQCMFLPLCVNCYTSKYLMCLIYVFMENYVQKNSSVREDEL